MSASVSRPIPFRQAARASLRAKPGEADLCGALNEAEKQLNGIYSVIVFRVDNDADAATHTMLDDIRRIADGLKAAADKYQWGYNQ